MFILMCVYLRMNVCVCWYTCAFANVTVSCSFLSLCNINKNHIHSRRNTDTRAHTYIDTLSLSYSLLLPLSLSLLSLSLLSLSSLSPLSLSLSPLSLSSPSMSSFQFSNKYPRSSIFSTWSACDVGIDGFVDDSEFHQMQSMMKLPA